MIFAVAMWLLAMPAGYVVGDVFCELLEIKPAEAEALRFASALMPPLSAIMATVIVVMINAKKDDEK